MRLSGRPDLGLPSVFIHDVVEVKLKRFDIRLLYPFQNINDDRSETIFVQVGLLIIWDLSDFALKAISTEIIKPKQSI